MCLLLYSRYAICSHRESISLEPFPDNPKCKGLGSFCLPAEFEGEDVDGICYECLTPKEKKEVDEMRATGEES